MDRFVEQVDLNLQDAILNACQVCVLQLNTARIPILCGNSGPILIQTKPEFLLL